MGNMCSMFKDMKRDSDAKFEKMSEANEGQSRLEKMDERFTVLEAMIDKTEQQSSEKKEKGMDTTEKSIDQKSVLDENKAILLLEKCIDTAGTKKDQFRIKCPANPITHAFIEFEDSDERDKFIRSANMQQMKLKERKNYHQPWMLQKDSTTKEWASSSNFVPTPNNRSHSKESH